MVFFSPDQKRDDASPTERATATMASLETCGLGEVLSAREMVEFSMAFAGPKPPRRDEVAFGGDDEAKFNEPTGSARERDLLEARLKQMEKIVTAPRINPRNLLSGGCVVLVFSF